MSTAAVSSSSIFQELQSFFQRRGSDLQQLGQALQSGDLAGAQQEFSAIQSLAQSGPFASGDAFKSNQRQQDLTAIGQALQSGNLAAAQQAFAQLQSTFHSQSQAQSGSSPAVVVNLSNPSSSSGNTTSPVSSGSEIILNLGTITPGEQITIGLNNQSNGSEQVTISVANQQGSQNPEQIALNLNPNSNQQIVLNLFNSATQTSSSALSLNATA
jgi:hypothetical protein